MIKVVVVEVLEKKNIYTHFPKLLLYLVFFNTDSMCKIHVVADNFLNTYIITHFLVGNFESVMTYVLFRNKRSIFNSISPRKMLQSLQ